MPLQEQIAAIHFGGVSPIHRKASFLSMHVQIILKEKKKNKIGESMDTIWGYHILISQLMLQKMTMQETENLIVVSS